VCINTSIDVEAGIPSSKKLYLGQTNQLFYIKCGIHGYMVNKLINKYLTLILYFQEQHYVSTGEDKVAQSAFLFLSLFLYFLHMMHHAEY
jgi:hypothetical protein